MPLPLDAVRGAAEQLTRPGCFFTGAGVRLGWSHGAEEVPWEVFQGRLLDVAHSRRTQRFESWNVHLLPDPDPPTPLLSLKLDAEQARLHVVRGVESYVHEGYDAGGNVYQTRERRKWVRELIASFDLADFDSTEDFRREVGCSLARAVTGTRLPLTPIEAPLPAFSFGMLFYAPPSGASRGDRREHRDAERTTLRGAARHEVPKGGSCRELLERLPCHPEPSRLIEAWLRAVPVGDLPSAARELAETWCSLGRTGDDLTRTFRRLFNEVSLSPWTDFADKVLLVLPLVLTPAQVLDFEGWLLRQLGRHLTAYDLTTFHHRGANYPDALLLDLVLSDYLLRLEREQACFRGPTHRLRRRALRQAWVVRRRYEGHLVPDAPTSPGERARVFPAGVPRVPSEQILQVSRRRRRLYEGEALLARLTPAVREALRESLTDLEHSDERQELAAAVFLDRPFGGGKAPVEPDGTLLLASLASSRTVAESRLRSLARDLDLVEADLPSGESLALPGLALEALGPAVRQGTLSLTDAARSAPDFVFRFTLPGSLSALRALLELAPLEGRDLVGRLAGRVLLARAKQGPGVTAYDESFHPLLELTPRLERGYAGRHGLEYPRSGFLLKTADSA
jgi:hypothetical protein